MADDWASGVQAFAKVIREAKQIFGVTAALDTISALTPPLQHKGGETEAATNADPWTEGHRAGFSAHDRDPNRSDIWQVGYSVGEIDRQRNIALGEPVPNYDGTKPEPSEPISTLQASSGEGETTVSELGAADVDGVDAQTAGATLPDGGQESPDLLQESRCSVAGCEIHGTPPIDATEPAAYSPVNNADEPVTKPEADFFAQALIPVQPGIEFSVDGGPKQATGAAKLFGGLGIFGKPKALVGEGA